MWFFFMFYAPNLSGFWQPKKCFVLFLIKIIYETRAKNEIGDDNATTTRLQIGFFFSVAQPVIFYMSAR